MRNNWLFGLTVIAVLGLAEIPTVAQEAQWIWSPHHKQNHVPRSSCYFRKTFSLRYPDRGQIFIGVDDQYVLYVNGSLVKRGESGRRLDQINITRFLRRGSNTIAVKASNHSGNTAALVARVLVRHRNGRWYSHSTDKTWKTTLNPFPLWNTSFYSDRGWDGAAELGKLGEAIPWDRREGTETKALHRGERFKVDREFEVRRVVEAERTGALIAMTFNEFGHIIASREGGPLLLIYGSKKDGKFDQVRTYCDKVKNCQGILALNGQVYVTADGPDGNGLYRLSDENRDGILEKSETLVKFKGEMGEHGAHGLTLGPDGMIYVVVGNHTSPQRKYSTKSTHKNYYEGDLVGPRYEDPGGHANGVKTPGGVIFRMDVDGKELELVAGGLRNAYDLAFDRDGRLFVHDSDMESDKGTTWYRPTKVFHVVEGGEYGWRSGWAKWPDYYFDGLPSITDTGRGSPTGAVFYNHFMFPARFHNSAFMADWSEGRIWVMRMKRQGASFKVDKEVFLEGDPLNVTDLDVGPDGALYFVTGGRGTGGGVYRVSWKGQVPPSVKNLGKGLAAAIRQPQLHSAWGRQKVAALKNQMGEQWDQMMVGVARSAQNPDYYRTRALDIMQLFGPTPSSNLLVTLSQDKSRLVRAKVARMMALHVDEETKNALISMLGDPERNVRAVAAQSLLRAGHTVPWDKIAQLVKSDDRVEAWTARRLAERLSADDLFAAIKSSKNHRVLVQAGLALAVAHPVRTHARNLIDHIRTRSRGFVSDRDFVDMLRLLQVVIHRSELAADDLTTLRDDLAREFPSSSATMNRELMRLLAYTQATDSRTMKRYIKFLNTNTVPIRERLHVALYLRFLKEGWSPQQKMDLLSFYEQAIRTKGGNSYPLYVMNATRDFGKTLSQEEGRIVLSQGIGLPNASLAALYTLPKQIDAPMLAQIKKLDDSVKNQKGDTIKRLQTGIVAVLARSGDDQSMAYLREIWNRDPDRRKIVAYGLAQRPTGVNWDLVVRSLPLVDNKVAPPVLAKLIAAEKKATRPQDFRQVILVGLRHKDNSGIANLMNKLLVQWTGEDAAKDAKDTAGTLKAWQDWFAKSHPNLPDATLPKPSSSSKWTLKQLDEFLQSKEAATFSAVKGAAVFEKAQCAKCHRFGTRGERMGPDLTSVSRRFTRQEILQSILFPSHNISSQYASKTVVTNKGTTYSGIVAPGAVGEKVVLQANGEKVVIDDEDIDEILPSKKSAMPDGLLNNLTLQEIANLFGYLSKSPPRSVVRRLDDNSK